MSTVSGSSYRVRRLLAMAAVRLLVVATLLQPSSAVMLAMLPGELAEASESEQSGESEAAETALASIRAGHWPRLVRRQQRLGTAPPGVVACSILATWQRLPRRSELGHRLPNGLTAPLRC